MVILSKEMRGKKTLMAKQVRPVFCNPDECPGYNKPFERLGVKEAYSIKARRKFLHKQVVYTDAVYSSNAIRKFLTCIIGGSIYGIRGEPIYGYDQQAKPRAGF